MLLCATSCIILLILVTRSSSVDFFEVYCSHKLEAFPQVNSYTSLTPPNFHPIIIQNIYMNFS